MKSTGRALGRLLPCFAFALGISFEVARAAPAPEHDRVRLLDSNSTVVRFVVEFPAPQWRETAGGAGRLRYPEWPGLTALARPGEPLVGVRLIRVALPPHGDVALEEFPAGGGSLGDARFPLAQAPGSQDPRFANLPESVHPLPAGHARLAAVGFERGLRIATVEVCPARRGDHGETHWSSEVEIRLRVAGTPAGRVRSAEVDAPVSPSGSASQASPRNAAWASSRDRSLLNPESAEAFRSPAQPAAALPPEWFDDAGGWLKLQITGNGIYTLTRDDLSQAGVPVSALDPRGLRIFSGPLVPELAWTTLGWDTLVAGVDTSIVSGWEHVYDRPGFSGGFGEAGGFEEIAIWVDGESDGAFDASDRVVFHALGPDNFRDRFGLPAGTEDYFENPYTDRTVYWLAWGGTFAGSPKRMEVIDATPGGGPVLSVAAARVHAERNTLYVPSLYQAGLRWESWFWDFLDNQSAGKRYTVALPAAAGGDSLSAHIRVWGGNIPDTGGIEALHHLQVEVNTTVVGLFQWGGGNVYDALTPLDIRASGIPAAASSDFIFRVPTLAVGRLDQSYLAWIDVTYRRNLDLGAQPGELPFDAGLPGRVLRVSQAPAGTLDIFDVSDFRNVRRITGFSVNTVGGSSRSIDCGIPGANRGYLSVATRDAPRSPAALLLDDPPASYAGASWLRDPAAALDHVIVSADAFHDHAETLAERRRESLFGVTPGRPGRSRAVRVSDVMDEFAWGMWDPTAIRYFLEYAHLYYGGSGADRLAYAVFLGDHTYDTRNFQGTGSPDLVPSWEDNREVLGAIEFGSVQYASDDPLVRFDGPDDPYLDLAVGRIPVSTAAAARAVIEDKIVGPESNPNYGSWRARVLLAADDLCQGGQDDLDGPGFLANIEFSDANLPPPYDRAKVYLTEYGTDCGITSKPAAAADFKAAWNEGAWLVNYVGHGDEAFFAGERLLTLAGVADLTNLDRLPLLIATASKSAKYNHPSQTSITEAIAVSPTGGAFAATGSVSNQTFSTAAFALNQAFILGLFEEDPGCLCPGWARPAGLAFAQAKQAIPAEAAKYVFFGDPAAVPHAPPLTALSMTGPDSLVRGSLAVVTARLADPLAANPVLELRAEDATRTPNFVAGGYRLPGDLMFRGEAGFTADSASAAFVVPLAAREGPDARIRAYARGDGWDAVAAVAGVAIQGQVDPSTDVTGPGITFNAHPAQVAVGDPLSAVLEDPSGIRLFTESSSALELLVRDAEGTEAARLPLTDLFAYDEGSYTRGTVTFTVPDLEPGNYTFTVLAADNFGNAASSSTLAAVTPGGGGVRFLDVYAYPNPLDSQTDIVVRVERTAEVSLRIYSVSGRLVRKGTMNAVAGSLNGWRWDARDEAGDAVANGVYLLHLSAGGGSGEDTAEHLERLVVVR